MNDQEHTHESEPVEQLRPAPEREREIIISNSGGRGSGISTAVVVIFAIVALVVVVVLAIDFLQREDSILPDGLDITVEVPEVPEGGGS